MGNLTAGAQAQVSQLTNLIETAEKLKSSTFHPGKSVDFVNWKSELETFISRNCGTNSPEWRKFRSLIFFPHWYDAKKHGPSQGNTPAIVVDEHKSDRETALTLYNDALTESIGLMKGLIQYINVDEWPLKPKEDNMPGNQTAPVYQTSFSQSQQQTAQAQVVMLLDFQNLINEKLAVTENETEKGFLEEIKSKLSTVKNIAELIQLLVLTASTYKLTIEQLLKIFS